MAKKVRQWLVDLLTGRKSAEYTIKYTTTGATIMADVELKWNANAVDETVPEYIVYRNGSEIGRVATPNPPVPTLAYTDPNVTPGVYQYEVAAVGAWGPSPKSDPVASPKPASKPTGVVLTVKVTISA